MELNNIRATHKRFDQDAVIVIQSDVSVRLVDGDSIQPTRQGSVMGTDRPLAETYTRPRNVPSKKAPKVLSSGGGDGRKRAVGASIGS